MNQLSERKQRLIRAVGLFIIASAWGVVGTLIVVRMLGCSMTPENELQPGVVEVEPLPPIPMPRDGAVLPGGVMVTE